MDKQTVPPQVSARQESQGRTGKSPLDLLTADLQAIRTKLVRAEKRRRSGVLAGQLLILLNEYRSGRRPSRRTLKRFFHFVARENAA